MGPGLGEYLAVGGAAALVTAAATPIATRVARARGRRWMVAPNERSVHTAPIPHVGGLAMLAGMFAAVLVATQMGAFGLVFEGSAEPLGICLAAIVVVAVGLLDDLRDLAPPGKVTGVVLAGVVLWLYGATMDFFRVPFFDVLILSSDWIPLVTVLWLLGMTQAINLIDGLDGLAAGIVAIGSFAFFLYSWKLGDLGLLAAGNAGPLVAIITAGICVGFLPFNFNPARIFMGDAGAFLLGLLLAVSTSLVGGRADPNTQDYVGQTFFFLAPLAIPVLILAVPILDTLFAIVRRASRRQALDVADKGHLHHRLMNLGHGHRRAVLILWAWTALMSVFVLYPVLTDDNPRYLPFGVGAIAIVLFTLLHPSVQRQRTVAIEEALSRPAFEQIDPSRPERQEAQHVPARPHDNSPDTSSGETGSGETSSGETSADHGVPPAVAAGPSQRRTPSVARVAPLLGARRPGSNQTGTSQTGTNQTRSNQTRSNGTGTNGTGTNGTGTNGVESPGPGSNGAVSTTSSRDVSSRGPSSPDDHAQRLPAAGSTE